MIDWGLVVTIALLGGVLALDRGPFLQSMVSRPICAAPIAGWLVGDFNTGLICGMYVELIWLARLPVGGSVPPDDTAAALAALVAAMATPSGWAVEARASFGVMMGLPWGWLGRHLEIRVKEKNGELFSQAKYGLKNGNISTLWHTQLKGLFRCFATGIMVAAAAAVLNASLGNAIVKSAPGAMEGAMELLSVLIPVIGAASLLCGYPGRKSKLAVGAGVFAWPVLGFLTPLLGCAPPKVKGS